MDGPRVFATLIEEATRPSIDEVHAELRDAVDRFSINLKNPLARAIQDAYRRGLMDGFQQGVAAECDRRDREDREHEAQQRQNAG